MSEHPEIELLLRLIDQAFDRKAWHGPTLRGSIRGVRGSEAVWKPASGRHSIWEIVLHAAYWKYIARRRLAGGERASFPRKGSNWFPVTGSRSEAEWRDDVRLLDEEHRKLRELIAAMPPAELRQRSPSGQWRRYEEIQGVAAHDLYHAGQIQLLKRLQQGR